MNECCCGFGHNNFYWNVIDTLRFNINYLIGNCNVHIFLTGGMGDFDDLFCRAVREVRGNDKKIKLILVKPYFSNALNTNKDFYETIYDDVIIPNELMGVHYKAAIQKRNRWMVDESQYVISGVYREFGGAYQTICYASQAGKHVIALAKK